LLSEQSPKEVTDFERLTIERMYLFGQDRLALRLSVAVA
jgi:hypothetical protein